MRAEYVPNAPFRWSLAHVDVLVINAFAEYEGLAAAGPTGRNASTAIPSAGHRRLSMLSWRIAPIPTPETPARGVWPTSLMNAGTRIEISVLGINPYAIRGSN
jgi:hypothetical protein